jgi:hypothetical protein
MEVVVLAWLTHSDRNQEPVRLPHLGRMAIFLPHPADLRWAGDRQRRGEEPTFPICPAREAHAFKADHRTSAAGIATRRRSTRSPLVPSLLRQTGEVQAGEQLEELRCALVAADQRVSANPRNASNRLSTTLSRGQRALSVCRPTRPGGRVRAGSQPLEHWHSPVSWVSESRAATSVYSGGMPCMRADRTPPM